MKTTFLDLSAAADFLGPGAVEVNRYQNEITDLVRRSNPFGQRIKQVPATGHPSRFFEQTAINSPTAAQAFVDPRNIVAVVGNPTRVERSVPLKALVSQINYNLFDLEIGAQQSQFAYMQARSRSWSCLNRPQSARSRRNTAVWWKCSTKCHCHFKMQHGASASVRAPHPPGPSLAFKQTDSAVRRFPGRTGCS